MPGETQRRSVFRLSIHLPHSARHGYSRITIRWSRILAGDKTTVQRPFQVVADRHGGDPPTAGASGAGAAGCRQPRYGCTADVAAVAYLKKISQTPCVPFSTLAH